MFQIFYKSLPSNISQRLGRRTISRKLALLYIPKRENKLVVHMTYKSNRNKNQINGIYFAVGPSQFFAFPSFTE